MRYSNMVPLQRAGLFTRHDRHWAPQMNPVRFLRHIPFGNCYQAGNPGFGSQQIIITRVELFGAGVIADMEHLAALIE